MSDLRTRIAAAIYAGCDNIVSPGLSRQAADAVIRELKQQWRADFGYDGYTNCETREEAKELVDDFNAALGDDVQDGEQAVVMHRYVTDWEQADE